MTKKDQTERALKLAIHRIVNGRPIRISSDRKLSISSVADEADCSDSLIHKDYPEILSKIRDLIDKDNGIIKKNTASLLKIEKDKNKLLRAEVNELKKKIQDIASINASLELKLQETESKSLSSNIYNLKK